MGFGQPLPAASRPQYRNGSWVAPNGDLLAVVHVSKDQTRAALVNPRTNTFYSVQAANFVNPMLFHGPFALPASSKFSNRQYNPSDIQQIEAIAKQGVSTGNISQIATSISGKNGNAVLQGSIRIPHETGPGVAPRQATFSLKLSGNGFNDAIPRYDVRKLEVYEKGSNTPLKTVWTPKPVRKGVENRYTGFENYSFQIPKSQLGRDKQYTVVAYVGINGEKAQAVRTEPMSVRFGP
jgi:hypothetical protein